MIHERSLCRFVPVATAFFCCITDFHFSFWEHFFMEGTNFHCYLFQVY